MDGGVIEVDIVGDDGDLPTGLGEVERVRVGLDDLAEAFAEGADCDAAVTRTLNMLSDLQAAEAEELAVRSELASIWAAVNEGKLPNDELPDDAWRQLTEAVASRVGELSKLHDTHAEIRDMLSVVRHWSSEVDRGRNEVSDAAEQRHQWDSQLVEAKRRQQTAKQVHAAANEARAAIVRRVFTESLNDVWRSVFTRLAPREPFVPVFGLPSATKTALELHLETVHVSGETSGAPQMMLSAGNLNTAALSLFIALHLAVEPIVPCLVFDDPVQSMDEVHIAQFACLIRVLSKNHGRQVIVAVHERELFEYLALELSPAYQGDALITVELGARSDDADRGITRVEWSPDTAIAV